MESTEQQQTNIASIQEWQQVYADNTDLRDPDRGILAFSRKFYPDRIKDRFEPSDTHFEIYNMFLDMFNPKYLYAQQRQGQVIVYRGGAKSTILNLICGSYVVCFNGKTIKLPGGTEALIDEEMMVLASETNTFATIWVNAIRAGLMNRELRRVFGMMKPLKIRDDEIIGKWRHDMFQVIKRRMPFPFDGKNLSVIGRGAGQQIRGLNIDGRPTIMLFDDLYSQKGIITIETRDKTRNWFFNEALNTLDNIDGKALLAATIVHEDTTPVDNMKDEQGWRTILKPIMPVDRFNYILDNYCKINRDLGTCEIPDRETCEKLEAEGYKTDWSSKFPLESLLLKFRGHIRNKTETGFWQEMFHLVIAESEKVFKKSNFVIRDFRYVTKRINNAPTLFVEAYDPIENKLEWRNVNSIIAIDSASSKLLGGATTAIVWVAMDIYHNIYFLQSISGRWGVSNEYKVDGTLERAGIVDKLFETIEGHISYHIKVGVEIYNVGYEVVRETKLRMQKTDKFSIFEVKQIDDKEERIVQTLSRYFGSRSAITRPNQSNLLLQLEFLGKAKQKDEADAAEIAVRNLKPPVKELSFDIEVKSKQQGFTSPFSNLISNEPNTKDRWKTY